MTTFCDVLKNGGEYVLSEVHGILELKKLEGGASLENVKNILQIGDHYIRKDESSERISVTHYSPTEKKLVTYGPLEKLKFLKETNEIYFKNDLAS